LYRRRLGIASTLAEERGAKNGPSKAAQNEALSGLNKRHTALPRLCTHRPLSIIHSGCCRDIVYHPRAYTSIVQDITSQCWYFPRHHIMYWYNPGHHIMYDPKFRAGMSCTIPGFVLVYSWAPNLGPLGRGFRPLCRMLKYLALTRGAHHMM
jgi:hypothetical protein